jgi:hypothetical protein
MLKHNVERVAEANEEIQTNKKVSNHNDSRGIRAENDRSDEKGGGSLDETASKSHHKQE